MAAQEIKVPDIGESDAVEVIEVLVSPGDDVEAEQPLITLESDKATLEVPTTTAGRISELQIAEGDTVAEGDVIALIEAADSGAAEQADEPAKPSEPDASQAESAPDNAAAGGGESVEVKVPDIGESDAVEVIEVLVSPGDGVEAEQPLITLESDKATLEVPSTTAGRISELKIAEGDTVAEGDVIARVEAAASGGGGAAPQAGAGSQAQPAEQRSQAPSSGPADAQRGARREPGTASQADRPVEVDISGGDPSRLQAVDETRFGKAHASPSVRKYAREIGADLGRINGSGRKGRITVEDVQAYVKDALGQARSGQRAGVTGGGGVPAQPDTDFSQFGEIETVELSRIRKISAKAVHNNWLLIPHVTQFDTADITDMEAFRQAHKEKARADGVKLTPLAFLLKASAAALQAFPDLNSSLTADGEHLVRKHYVHIAVAVDTPNGLLMPVIRDVDQKGIYQLARDLDDVSSRARDGQLKGSDMQGACFSISSLGGVGGTAFTPIVNSPEVGILGVSKHDWQPVWNGTEFEPRLILPLALSYDHRVIDGAMAARITDFISDKLSDLRMLLL